MATDFGYHVIYLIQQLPETHLDKPAALEALRGPLDDAHERLSRAWGAVSHLHGVDDNPAIREAYNDNLPAITQYWTELGQNLALFERYKALAASSGFAALDPAQRTIINNELRDSSSVAPNCRPTRNSATPRSRRSCPRCRRNSPRTCWTPPMPSA